MGSEYNAPGLAIESHEKLTSWFCSVHSVLVWTQKQLVALGKHLWIEGITPSVSPTKSIGELSILRNVGRFTTHKFQSYIEDPCILQRSFLKQRL